MTRQNKSVKLKQLATQITDLHKKGEKGAKSTTPKHDKDASKRLYTASKRGAKDTGRKALYAA